MAKGKQARQLKLKYIPAAMKRTGAFTLIELLIASAIFVVVVLTIYSAFRTGLFGYRNIEDTVNIYQTARQILERLNLDLRNFFVYSNKQTKFAGDAKSLSFLTLVDYYRDDKILQDYAFISYELEGNKLMRLCRKNQEALNDKSEIEPEEMADNIEIIFSYFYFDAADNKLKEKDSWGGPSSPQNEGEEFPAAVKVKLTIPGETAEHFERTIYLPLTKIK